MPSQRPMDPWEHKERQSMQKCNWTTNYSLWPCHPSTSDYKSSYSHCLMVFTLRNYINGWCQLKCLLCPLPSLTVLQQSGCFSPLWDVTLSRFQSDQGNTLVLTLPVSIALATLWKNGKWGHVFSREMSYLGELR